MPEQDDEFTILIEEDEDRPTLPVTGAWGGPSPDGNQVVVHLHVDHATLPSILTHSVAEDGTVDLRKGEKITRGNITRRVVATLVMSPEVAASIGGWLLGKSEAAKKVRDTSEKDEV